MSAITEIKSSLSSLRIQEGVLYFAWAFIATTLEVMLCVLDVPLASRIFFHFLVVTFCVSLAGISWYKGWDVRFPVFAVILVATLGPFGGFVVSVALLMFPIYLATADPLKALLAALLPEAHSDPTELLYERIIYGLDDYDVEYNPLPFMDVITLGSEKQKRLAIEKMLRYYCPVFAPALFKALHDPSNGIRVLAATAIATLDQIYFKKCLELEKRYRAFPNKRKEVLVFAEYCDMYASSKILDEDRLKKVTFLAIEGYETYLKLDPDNAFACTALGRLYITSDKSEKGKKLLESLVFKQKHLSHDVFKWYLCALYNLKEYASLRRFIEEKSTSIENSLQSKELNELISAWVPELYSEAGGVS